MANKEYPCDIPDSNGEFHCPFEAEFNSSGYACRIYCGMGVDESEIPDDEDEITAEDLAEYQGRYK
jgi:hypothetical protein